MGGLVSIDSYSHMSVMIFDLVSQFLWLQNLCEPSIEALVPRLQTDPSVSTASVSGQDIENFLYSKTSSKPLFRNILSSSPPRLSDIRSICVISASYYPFIGLWWAHMKFQSEIYGFWKIEKITFFQGSPLWKLFGTSKNANFQCIYKICCSFVILWDTDIPNMSN